MSETASLPWYRQLTGYHWFVFTIASAAWFFDCLDQRLFSMSRIDALKTLAPEGTPIGEVQAMGKHVTAWFLVGWGIGGVVFGALGDRYGRARMLSITVLIYSICTGMNYFSESTFHYTLFRLLTGVGIGGVFGLAVALIAETVPDAARVQALGWLQILSTGGNVTAGLCYEQVAKLEAAGAIEAGQGWRWLFVIGALPALLVIFIYGKLKEPEPWLRAKEAGTLPKGAIIAPYANLLKEAKWRKNLLVGTIIASAGVVGLWAIGEYAIDLQSIIYNEHYQTEILAEPAMQEKIEAIAAEDDQWFAQLVRAKEADRTEQLAARADADEVRSVLKEIDGQVAARSKKTKSGVYIVQMLGAAAGMWLFTKFAMATGRRMAFAVGFAAALVITVYAYWTMTTPAQAYVLMPLMYAAQLGLFAGFAIYLPELFPSRLRSTGTSFCYNLGRFAAAGGSLFSAQLATGLYGSHGSPGMERYSAITMCVIFLAGLAVLPFAPETKDKPLPE